MYREIDETPVADGPFPENRLTTVSINTHYLSDTRKRMIHKTFYNLCDVCMTEYIVKLLYMNHDVKLQIFHKLKIIFVLSYLNFGVLVTFFYLSRNRQLSDILTGRIVCIIHVHA